LLFLCSILDSIFQVRISLISPHLLMNLLDFLRIAISNALEALDNPAPMLGSSSCTVCNHFSGSDMPSDYANPCRSVS
jgi:hypothetical protein